MENKLTLINQKNLTITGIKKVIGINESSATLELENTGMQITGQDMEVKRLDIESGVLEIDGAIICIKYNFKREKVGFIKRIFK